MTLKRFFRYATGAKENKASADQMKKWFINQLKLEFTDQDFEIFYNATMQGKDMTEDAFIDICRNGTHNYSIKF